MKQDSLRDHLLAIRKQCGNLTASSVVVAAQADDHPLHVCFEWDDSVAGHKYREDQARELIRSVRVTYKTDGNEEYIRYFVSVQEPEGRAYHPSDEVAHDELLTVIVLREMEREWRQMESRYGHFKEFSEMVQNSLETAEKR